MGGTWVRAALVSADGVVHAERRVPLPADPAGQLDAPRQAAAPLVADETAGIGLAVAGVVRAGRLVTAANLGLRDVDLAAALATTFGLPTAVVNDAQAAALAEVTLGAARAATSAAYVTVGTGIGGAVVEAGRIVTGRGSAGEFGHMTLWPGGPRCGCGGRGCWERLAGGAALGTVTLLPARADDDARWDWSRLAPRLLTIEDAADFTAWGLRNVVAAVDPDVVVLGGGLALGDARFVDLARAAFAEVRPGWAGAEIRAAELGTRSGVVGAALAALTVVG